MLGNSLKIGVDQLLLSSSSIWHARLCRSKAIEARLYESSSILILSELSSSERLVEKQLLSKRHELLQSGIEKQRIKIRNLKLYVDCKERKSEADE